MHNWAFQIGDWGLGIGEYAAIDGNRLEYDRVDWNRPIPAYSSLILHIPAYSRLFQFILAYSSLFQSIPAYSSPLWPILAYSSIFQPNQDFVIIFQPIFQSTFSNPQSPIHNLIFGMSNCAFYPQLEIWSVSSLICFTVQWYIPTLSLPNFSCATLVAVLTLTPEEREMQRRSLWQQDRGPDPLPTLCVVLLASGVLSYGLALYQLLLRPL